MDRKPKFMIVEEKNRRTMRCFFWVVIIVVFLGGVIAGSEMNSDTIYEKGRAATLAHVKKVIKERMKDGGMFYVADLDMKVSPHPDMKNTVTLSFTDDPGYVLKTAAASKGAGGKR